MGHTFETFYISEIQSVNEVFKEYSTEIERDGKQNILATYFSEKGQVTEQSIHNGIASLNEKLETAGMKRLEDAIRKHKK